MRKPIRRKKTRDRYGNVRLNLRMSPELEAFARQYAADHHTTVTQLITDYFGQLQEKERYDHAPQL